MEKPHSMVKNEGAATNRKFLYGAVVAVLIAFAFRGILNFGSMPREVKMPFIAVYAVAIGGLYLIFFR